MASDDISLRISAAADGEAAVERALSFARHLSRAIGGSVRAAEADDHSPPPPPLDWSKGTLASVLPSVADRLGVRRYAGMDVFDLPETPRVVVVLVDGLGHDLLLQRGGHSPS